MPDERQDHPPLVEPVKDLSLTTIREIPPFSELEKLPMGPRIAISMLDYGASWWGNRYSNIDKTDLKRWMTGGSFLELSTFMGGWRELESAKIGRKPEAYPLSTHNALMTHCDRTTQLAEVQHVPMASLFDRLRFFVNDHPQEIATATEIGKDLLGSVKVSEDPEKEVVRLWQQSLKDNPPGWTDSLQESCTSLMGAVLRATRSFRDLTKIDGLMAQKSRTEPSQQQISAPKK